MATRGAVTRGATAVAALAAALCACSGASAPGEDTLAAVRPSAGPRRAPEALLAPGAAPTIEKFGGTSYEVVAGVSAQGCVTVTLEDGQTVLLFAPYDSRLAPESPPIRLGGGGGSFDVGDTVELSGWVQDTWKAAGTSAPTHWPRCVGGRGDHEPMLVVAGSDYRRESLAAPAHPARWVRALWTHHHPRQP